MLRFPILLTLAIAAGGCAVQPGGTGSTAAARECFSASGITGFSVSGPDKAIVNIGFQESWELTLAPGCPDVDYAMKIGVVSRGSQRICTGRPAELVVPTASGSSSQRCLVRNIRKLSPEEAAAARGLTPGR